MSKPVTINKEEELIAQCPKAIAKLKTWLEKELQESSDPKETDLLVTMMLRYNPRILYDFFDDNNIVLTIRSIKRNFNPEINGQPTNTKPFTSRAEAEEAGFRSAFKEMEDGRQDSTESQD